MRLVTVARYTLATTSVAGDRCEGRCLAMPWVSGVVTEGGHQTWLWFWLHTSFPGSHFHSPDSVPSPTELQTCPCWPTGPLSDLASGAEDEFE